MPYTSAIVPFDDPQFYTKLFWGHLCLINLPVCNRHLKYKCCMLIVLLSFK